MKLMRTTRVLPCTVLGVCLLLSCSLQVWADAPGEFSAAAYAEEVQAGISAIAPRLPDYVTHAEEVARYMVAGGTLWLAGDHGFVYEGLNRAGGLMASKQLKSPDELKSGDIMLYGLLQWPTREDEQFLLAATRAGVLCLTVGPWFPGPPMEPLPPLPPTPPLPQLPWSFDWYPGTPTPRHLEVPGLPASDPGHIPTVSPVQAAALWAFSAELISALTRIGKMPPMWQSVMVEGGRERNAEHLKLTWEPGVPEPVDALLLGRTYLARLGNYLRRLRGTQLGKFEQAGALAADAKAAGHVAWYACLGHMLPDMPGQIGDPGVLETLSVRKPEELSKSVSAGDVILYVGYYEPYGEWVEEAHALGAKIVTVVSGTPERAAEDMGADINISGCWPFGDATIEVPGYDISVLPPSGVIQSAAYWMLVAETARRTK